MSRFFTEDDLSFFENSEIIVVGDFLMATFEYLKNNLKHRSYTGAASKLGMEKVTIEKIIEKLAYLMIETVKRKLSQSDFLVICGQGLTNECTDKLLLIWEKMESEKDFLNQLVCYRTNENYLQYSNLDWRIDYLLASRSLNQPSEVHLTMSLSFQDTDEEKRIFVSDIPMAQKLAEVLESALNETKTSHVRKLQRAFQF